MVHLVDLALFPLSYHCDMVAATNVNVLLLKSRSCHKLETDLIQNMCIHCCD